MRSRIAINGRFLTRPATGVDRFARELLRAWSPRYAVSGATRVVLPANSQVSSVEGVALPFQRVGSLKGHAWEQVELPLHCSEDLLLNLCNTGPVLHRSQLVVLHDAGVNATRSSYKWTFRTWQTFLIGSLMRRANIVATVSKFSASELIRWFPGIRRRVEIISESGEHILDVPADHTVLQRLQLRDERFVLAVGSRSPNKNFSAIIRAAALLSDMDIKIVAVGGSNSRIFSGVELEAKNLILAGYVTDGELRSLYENAQCFVFPSFYEGFGLPPLEAMHCGCPTLVSNRSAMPEVCGEASLYFEPDDPADIAQQLRRVLSSGTLRSEMREAGFIRTKLFTWNKAADQLHSLLT
ncbi:MAG: glycosyltransferase family 4 protein [Pseudomonadota bacterium]|nr:glycosyltransferase family 4 protein [Pseudomonadota bacterium]